MSIFEDDENRRRAGEALTQALWDAVSRWRAAESASIGYEKALKKLEEAERTSRECGGPVLPRLVGESPPCMVRRHDVDSSRIVIQDFNVDSKSESNP